MHICICEDRPAASCGKRQINWMPGGFTYKSGLVWIKDQMGMGNYWRISHEYLLLGIRGQLGFRSHRQRSWVGARRSIHSRKPGIFRHLVECVSPGPYLELFGREEIPMVSGRVS